VVPTVGLNNGAEIPQIGFGVFRIADDATEQAVLTAIDAGYRSIDTASLYGNEGGVGRAVASCGLPRSELFITTKLWNDDQGYRSTLDAFNRTLDRLGLDYIDLYLIHWPVPAKGAYLETWRAFEEINAGGRAPGIGVSSSTRACNRARCVPSTVLTALRRKRGARWLKVRSSRIQRSCRCLKSIGRAPAKSCCAGTSN
jgi:diketogulonate reductase-like aldo/keto reductase